GELKVLEITGVEYDFSIEEIRVKRGDRVRIEFTSQEGLHDLVIDAFDVRTQRVSTGESDVVEFVADEAGTFEYYCSVNNHRQLGMVGTLIVE
ncbi:MAG: cupredoxin domain-containing protein, partial [Candidatus Dojkabacteria bacterium]|nr:cupredoxin domain-containing protein [Candidatus Dojkabacteria bacterium]